MLQTLFSLRTLIGRRTYLAVGVALFALKATVEFGLFALLAPGKWQAGYLVYLPLVTHRPALPQELLLALFVWTLPFIWVATTMSMRRSVDAGHTPWVCLLLFIPALNYLVMLWLALQPSHPDPDWGRTPVARHDTSRARSALWGVAAAVAVGGVALAVSVYFAGEYATALFLSTPFLLGAVSAAVYNREATHTAKASVGVATLSLLVAFAAAFFFLIEGLVCLSAVTSHWC